MLGTMWVAPADGSSIQALKAALSSFKWKLEDSAGVMPLGDRKFLLSECIKAQIVLISLGMARGEGYITSLRLTGVELQNYDLERIKACR